MGGIQARISAALRGLYEASYEGGASEWRRIGARSKAANVMALCGDVPRQSVLEVGAGDGALVARLSELGFAHQFTALEVSDAAVRTIQARNIPALIEVRAYPGDAFPFETGRFDLAILSHVLEHVEHPRLLLYEAARVARHVFVEVPLEDTLRRRGDFVLDPVGHINFFSARTLRWLLQSSGLRVLQERTTNPSREMYAYHRGRMGKLDWALKQGMLALLGPAAPYLTWRYHHAVLCAAGPGPDHRLLNVPDAS